MLIEPIVRVIILNITIYFGCTFISCRMACLDEELSIIDNIWCNTGYYVLLLFLLELPCRIVIREDFCI